MANITAQMVKELRDATGAGMMDCKAALNETGGDMEAAIALTGQVAGRIEAVRPVADIIADTVDEFRRRIGELASYV